MSSSTDKQVHAVHEDPQPQRTGLAAWYYKPTTQITMLGLVCFLGPGLFNAVNGLGGGGQVDATTGDNGNAALYSTFAVMSFFAGTVNNKLGSRLTLLLGSSGYCLYIGSFLALNIHTDAGGFVVAAGAILGICAGLLWAAQGSIMLSYPTEGGKGRAIAIFWAVFNLGGVVGSAVSFGANYYSTAPQVSNETYIAFIVLMACGMLVPMLMADPKKMYRDDGTKVSIVAHPSWSHEFKSVFIAITTDPAILLLLPMFFASNWFYTWQFSDFNGALFTIRTRGLNSMIYWLSQIFGSLAMGLLLDSKLPRKTRAWAGWLLLFVMIFAVHIWGYFYQTQYTRETLPNIPKIDFQDSIYPSRIWFYIFCGLLDAMWQTNVYWLMGAMSNDPSKLAYFTGLYKAIQSAGGAISWRVDATLTPFMNIFISTWVLLAAGLVFAVPMIWTRVKEHTEIEDETLVRRAVDQHIVEDPTDVREDPHDNEKEKV